MRMARINLTVPDDLIAQARNAGLNVSRVAANAIREELERRAKIAELDAYLSQLDDELGPVPEAERAAAATWADDILAGSADAAEPGPTGRTA